MAGKSGKSGKRAGPGKKGGGVEKRCVGKRVLAGSKFRVLDGGETVLGGNEEKGWEVYKGLVRKDGGWENGEVRLEDDLVMEGSDWGASGQGEWKVWEDETKEDKGKGLLEEEEKVESIVKKVRELREEEENGLERILEEEEREEESLGLLEEWKIKKEREEKEGKRERRMREKEGVLNRGKEKGWGREETLKLWEGVKDYREVVEETRYVFGMDVVEARCFVMDREMRKLMEEITMGGKKVGKEGENRKEVVGVGEALKEDRKVAERKEELVVEGGRTYGEIMRGVGGKGGNGNAMEVERKLRREREEEERKSLEVEERLGKVVEVVLDSQGNKGKEVWKKEEVEEELGLKRGEIERIEGRGTRLRVTMKSSEKAEEVGKIEEGRWEKVVGGKVKERKRLEQWVGIVLPGVEVEVWEKRMELLREVVEQENGIKLMKRPVWIADERRRRQMGLKYVGVVLYVTRESVRVEMLRRGVLFLGDRKVVKRWVEEKQLMFCTKCATVGHNWWDCRKKEACCSVCAVKGHTGWQHRCDRCKVGRVACVHYRKCAMCGGNHTMREAGEGNCWGVRAEMVRLRSLVC